MRALYGFLILAGVTLLVLPLAVPVIKTSAEFSMFNTNWDGCSEFAKILARSGELVPVMYSYNTIKLSKLNGVLLIIGPSIDFSQQEAEEVKTFLKNGGVLFIADDFGMANSLLAKLNVSARFSTKPLQDIFYSKRAEFPVVVRIAPELPTNRLVLNIPSVIVGVKEGEVFSSKVSIVGKNMRSYPIMAEIKYGKGKIILLSDPSILINDMFKENKQFTENLVKYLGSGPFYFDEAHHLDFNPYAITTIYIHRDLDREKTFQIFLAVAALAIIIESGIASRILNVTTFILKRKEEKFEELPEWVDRRILEKIINEIKTGSRFSKGYKIKQ